MPNAPKPPARSQAGSADGPRPPPKCAACNATTFVVQALRAKGTSDRLEAVTCTACGAVVGVLPDEREILELLKIIRQHTAR